MPHKSTIYKAALFLGVVLLTAAGAFAQCENWLPIKKNGNWGFIDRLGNVRIPPDYQYLDPFTKEGYAVASNDFRTGVLDTSGNWVVPCKYDSVLHLGHGRFKVKDGHHFYLANTTTVFEHTKTDHLRALNEHLILIKDGDFFKIFKNDGSLLNDEIVTYKHQRDYYYQYLKDDQWHIIAEDGTRLVRDTLISVSDQRNLLAILRNANEKYGVLLKDSLVVPFEYDGIQVGTIYWQLFQSDSIVAMYNLAENRIIPRQQVGFTDAAPSPYKGVLYSFSPDGKRGLVSETGKELIPPIYRYVYKLRQADYYIVGLDGLTGIYDMEGNLVIKPEYNRIMYMQNGMFSLNKANRNGVAAGNGKVVVPVKYDKVEVWKDRVKAFDGTEMTVYELDGHRVIDTYAYENVLNIRVGGNGIGEMGRAPVQGFNIVTPRGQPGWVLNRNTRMWTLNDSLGNQAINGTFDAIEINDSLNITFTMRCPGKGGEGYFVRGGGSLNPAACQVGIVNHVRYIEVQVPTYHSINTNGFNHGHAFVQYVDMDGYAGFISRTNRKWPVSFKYLGIESDSMMRAMKGGYLYTDRYEREQTIERYSGYVERFKQGFQTADDTTKSRDADKYNKKFLMAKEGKWGFIDVNGQERVPFEYQYLSDMRSGRAIAVKDNGFGVIDSGGTAIINFEFSDIDRLPLSGDSVFAGMKKARVFGLMDQYGTLLMPCTKDDMLPFSNRLMLVEKDDLLDFYTPDGTQFTHGGYTDARSFSEGYAAVSENRKWHFVDEKGQLLGEMLYREVGDFHDGRAWAFDGRKYAFVDGSGSEVIPFKYKAVKDFSNGYAAVASRGKFGLIDVAGNEVMAEKYTDLYALPNTAYWVFSKGKKFGVMTAEGKIIIPAKYKEIGQFGEGKIAAKTQEGWVFVDEKGKEMDSPPFTEARFFQNGRAAVKRGRYWGFIDHDGLVVARYKYKEVSNFNENRCAVEVSKLGWGVIDQNGNEIVPTKYNDIKDYSQGFAVARNRDAKYVLLDRNGEVAFDMILDDALPFSEGRAAVKHNGNWGLINTTGHFLVKPMYDKIAYLGLDLYGCYIERQQGLFTSSGRYLTSLDFEEIVPMGGGIYQMHRNGEVGYVNSKGEWLWQLSR